MLHSIINSTHNRIEILKATSDRLAPAQRSPKFLEHQFDPQIIAEIKYASPSLGDIRRSGTPQDIATSYIDGGASAISVLTEPTFFKGSVHYLSQVRKAHPEIPILMKDFFFHESQILQAAHLGADAVLLISDLLTKTRMKQLISFTRELKLFPLVEVHSLESLFKAYDSFATYIGINNRNLKTMKTDPNHSLKLSNHLDPDRFHISESGLQSAKQISQLHKSGFDAFLVGSSLMKEKVPGTALAELRGGM